MALVVTRSALAVVLTPYGIEPTLITVTTDSDASNGVVSTVEGLLADPGPDGISLREAIEATNNDPGRYAIRFAPALEGATIRVGSSAPPSDLPPLTGGGVLIDGDIDGDGAPDVRILKDGSQILGTGFTISSSGNRLSAITLRGFVMGVELGAIETCGGNVISGLVMTKIAIGIHVSGYPESQVVACIDTQFVGNTIEVVEKGISIQLLRSGDRVERLTIAGNTIRVLSRRPYREGIDLTGMASARGTESPTCSSRTTRSAEIPRVPSSPPPATVTPRRTSSSGFGSSTTGSISARRYRAA